MQVAADHDALVQSDDRPLHAAEHAERPLRVIGNGFLPESVAALRAARCVWDQLPLAVLYGRHPLTNSTPAHTGATD